MTLKVNVGLKKSRDCIKLLRKWFSVLLCHLFCQDVRSVAQVVWQEYLWTATFTPTARGDIIGPNKGGFLLHEGKA